MQPIKISLPQDPLEAFITVDDKQEKVRMKVSRK